MSLPYLFQPLSFAFGNSPKAPNACCVIAPQLLQATKTTGTDAPPKTVELRSLKSFWIEILEYPSSTENEPSPHL